MGSIPPRLSQTDIGIRRPNDPRVNYTYGSYDRSPYDHPGNWPPNNTENPRMVYGRGGYRDNPDIRSERGGSVFPSHINQQ